jgi:hypothetical protein
MSDDEILRTGGCACGAVRFETRGEPDRIGLCHCMTCRKAHASAFNPFVVFRRDQVTATGEMRAWESTPGYRRWFCGACGSRVYGEQEGEYELALGGFDQPGTFAPQYESWVKRREPWLQPLPLPQFDENRTP